MTDISLISWTGLSSFATIFSQNFVATGIFVQLQLSNQELEWTNKKQERNVPAAKLHP